MKNRIIRVRQHGGTKAASLQSPTVPEPASAEQGSNANQTAAALPPELRTITTDLDRQEMCDLAAELEQRAAQIRSALATGAATTAAGTLEDANRVIEPDLSEFAMDLDAPGRELLAERFGRWARQLRASVAILRGLQFVQANPNN